MRKEIKKNFLMIAAAAMVMASCAESYELKKDLKGEETPVKIAFTSLTEKATKGDATSKSNLEFYHQTFSVIGSKKSTVNDSVQYVFRSATPNAANDYAGVTNTYVPEGDNIFGDWKYDVARYWDKQANYKFVAYAPAAAPLAYHFASSTAEVGDANGDIITTNVYTLVGTNLQATPTEAEKYNGFAEKAADGDIDLMTSAVAAQAGTDHSNVNLQFKHILAKLNVAVAKTPSMDSTDVEINYIKIKGLKDSGTYSEKAATPATGEATTSGWTASKVDTTYTLQNTKVWGVNVGTTTATTHSNYTYFIESLVMPQAIAANATLEVSYTTTTYDAQRVNKHTETNVATINFGNAVGNVFNGRSNYTLFVSVGPDVITFDAGVDAWADKTYDASIVD